jgi:3-hydroxyisobutyrate dehydrogenase
MSTVGVVGIGNMGWPIAQRLLDLGYAVRVRDLVPAREATARTAGAQVCTGPAALAVGCDAVIVVVVNAAQTAEVLFGTGGAANALRPGAALVLCPTIAPTDTQRFAERLAALGIDAIDAPMSGGPARARDGTMSLMVACSDAVFERHRALLQNLSSQLFRVGDRPGAGAKTKLVNNLLAAINLAGAAEALALATRLGLDAARTLDVIERSSGQSWIGSERLRRALAGDLTPRAHMALLAKDSALALDAAQAQGVDPALGRVVAALLARACADGLEQADDAALYDWLLGPGAEPPQGGAGPLGGRAR